MSVRPKKTAPAKRATRAAEPPPAAEPLQPASTLVADAEKPAEAPASFAALPGVCWHRLVLQGFGPFRERVELSFPAGVAVVMAGNEMGKTTLMHGLMAVLFGLRDAAGGLFTTSRFRHWRGTDRFSGELELTASNGVRYLLQRQFDTHQVRLHRLTPDGSIPEWSGTHNPGLSRSQGGFEERLKTLIGTSSRSMFQALYCVEQPLPAVASIHEDLQRLLGGGGDASYSTALDELAGALSALTSTTGERGVTESDLPQPQRLELLAAERADLTERSQRIRTSLEELRKLGLRLHDIEVARTRLLTEQKQTVSALDVWNQWERMVRDWHPLRQKLGELQRSYSLIAESHGTLQAAEAAMAEWPEYQGASREVGQELDRVVDLVRATNDCEQRIKRLSDALEAIARELDECSCSLAEGYGDVLRDGALASGLAVELRELRERSVQVEEMRARCRSLEKQADELRAQVQGIEEADGKEPALRGVSPDVAVRVLAGHRELVRGWRRHQALALQRAEVARELEAFAPLAESGLDFETLRKEAALSQTDASVQAAVDSTQARALGDEIERLEKNYHDVSRLDEALLPVMESKVALLETSKRRQWELERARSTRLELERKRMMRALAGLVVGLVLGAGVVVAQGGFHGGGVVALVLLPVITAGIALIQAGSPSMAEEEKLQAECTRVDGELARLDRVLGSPLSSVSVFDLSILRRRRLEYAGQRKAIELRQRDLAQVVAAATPPGQDPRARQVLALFASPLAAIESWKSLGQRAAYLKDEHEALSMESFGVASARVEALTIEEAGRSWKECAALLHTVGAQGLTTPGRLVDWMEARPEGFWDELQQRLDRTSTDSRRHDGAVGELQRMLEVVELHTRALEDNERATAQLRQRTAPFDESSDPEVVYVLLREAAAVLSRQSALETQRALLVVQLEEETAVRNRLVRTLRPLQTELEGILKAADMRGESPRARWQAYSDAAAHLQASQKAYESLLQTAEVPSLDQIEFRLSETRALEAQLSAQIRALSEQNALLPRFDELSGERSQKEARRKLEMRLDEMADELERCEELRNDLALQQARLQGREPANLASLEERLAEVIRREQECAIEADVLTVAYHELLAASRTYQQMHRNRLQQAASEGFARITGVTSRAITLGDDLQVRVVEQGGVEVDPASLSQGAQDQLYLAIRLAVAELLGGVVALPFIFDDPFANADAQRLGNLRSSVARLGGQRQVIVLTHRAELASWGERVAVAT